MINTNINVFYPNKSRVSTTGTFPRDKEIFRGTPNLDEGLNLVLGTLFCPLKVLDQGCRNFEGTFLTGRVLAAFHFQALLSIYAEDEIQQES